MGTCPVHIGGSNQYKETSEVSKYDKITKTSNANTSAQNTRLRDLSTRPSEVEQTFGDTTQINPQSKSADYLGWLTRKKKKKRERGEKNKKPMLLTP